MAASMAPAAAAVAHPKMDDAPVRTLCQDMGGQPVRRLFVAETAGQGMASQHIHVSTLGLQTPRLPRPQLRWQGLAQPSTMCHS